MSVLARIATVALAATLLLAGCGGGSHATTTTSSSRAGASVPTTATLTAPQTTTPTTTPTTATLTVPQTTTTRTRSRTSTTRTSTTRTSTTRTSTTRTSTARRPQRRHPPRPTRAQIGATDCRRSVEQSAALTNDEKAQLEQLCQFAWNGNRSGVAQAKRALCVTIVADSGLVGPTAAAEVASCEQSGQPAQPIPVGGIPPAASFALR